MRTARQILKAEADGTPEWLEQRTQGVGGTDMADLHLGFKSAFRLWREKKGLVPAEDVSPELQALFDYGHSREPELARIFTQRTGQRVRNTGTWARKGQEWALANPDRFVGSTGLLEIKTTGAYTEAAKDWRAGRVPAKAWVQAHWYAHVTGRRVLWFIAEVDRVPVILGPFDRDEDLIEALAAEAESLWDLVQRGTEPDPTAPDVALAYPASVEGVTVEVEPWDDTVTDLERWHQLRAQRDEIDAELEDIEGAVKLRMGEAEALTLPDGTVLATWKSHVPTRLDVTSLAEAHPDVYARFTDKIPDTRLRVADLKKAHPEAKDAHFMSTKVTTAFDKKALEADHPGIVEKYTVKKEASEFDEAAFRAAHPDLADAFTTTTYKDTFDAARFAVAEPALRDEFTVSAPPVRRFTPKENAR